MSIDWSEAPEGATHYVVKSICPWEKRVGDDWYFYDIGKKKWIALCADGDDRIKRSLKKIVEAPA